MQRSIAQLANSAKRLRAVATESVEPRPFLLLYMYMCMCICICVFRRNADPKLRLTGWGSAVVLAVVRRNPLACTLVLGLELGAMAG